MTEQEIIKRVKAGTTLCREGEPAEGIILLRKGEVTVFVTIPAGKETEAVTIDTWRNGQFICPGDMGTSDPRWVYSVMALSTLEVIPLSFGRLSTLLQNKPEVGMAIFASITGLVGKMMRDFARLKHGRELQVLGQARLIPPDFEEALMEEISRGVPR